jgi:hypothetical protein
MVGVDKDYRRMGIARKLTEICVKSAKELNCQAIYSQVHFVLNFLTFKLKIFSGSSPRFTKFIHQIWIYSFGNS